MSVYKDGSARDQDRINFKRKERQKAAEVQAVANAKKSEIAKKVAADAEAKKVAEAKKAAADAETAKKAAEIKKAAAKAEAAPALDTNTDASAAATAASAPNNANLPWGWSEAKDPTSGRKYYYNAQRAVQWGEKNWKVHVFSENLLLYSDADFHIIFVSDVPTSLAKTVAKDTEATIPPAAKIGSPAAATPATAPTSALTKQSPAVI